jgi:hypothetical protein
MGLDVSSDLSLPADMDHKLFSLVENRLMTELYVKCVPEWVKISIAPKIK